MASEAFCRSMNAPIAAHEKWVADHPDGKEHRAAPRGAGLVGGRGKPSTHVLERHQTPITLRDFNKPRTPVAPPSEPLVTAPMAKFIRGLLDSRAVSDDLKARWSAQVVEGHETLSKEKGHKAIDWLKKQPYAPKVVPTPVERPTFEVPDGRYALDSISGKNEIVFYRVTKNRGYWNVDLQVSDNWVRVNWDKAQSVLSRIEKDGWKEAMARYGKELEFCGHCGKPLTDDESRARGIGPVCFAKYF